jgi:hypothetical protein
VAAAEPVGLLRKVKCWLRRIGTKREEEKRRKERNDWKCVIARPDLFKSFELYDGKGANQDSKAAAGNEEIINHHKYAASPLHRRRPGPGPTGFSCQRSTKQLWR